MQFPKSPLIGNADTWKTAFYTIGNEGLGATQ